jgi:hypothetical protein
LNLRSGKLAREITAQFQILPSLGHHVRRCADCLNCGAEVLGRQRTPQNGFRCSIESFGAILPVPNVVQERIRPKNPLRVVSADKGRRKVIGSMPHQSARRRTEAYRYVPIRLPGKQSTLDWFTLRVVTDCAGSRHVGL